MLIVLIFFINLNFTLMFITKVRRLQTHVDLLLGWRGSEVGEGDWVNVSVMPVSERGVRWKRVYRSLAS